MGVSSINDFNHVQREFVVVDIVLKSEGVATPTVSFPQDEFPLECALHAKDAVSCN